MSSWAPPCGPVATPAVLVDAGRLDRNLRAMAGSAARRGLTLRPHAKTHKSIEIARRQLGYGAAGVSVATLGEAETFADAGHAEIFVAYPLWIDRQRAPRLSALAGRVRLTAGVDSLASVHQMAGAVRGLAELRPGVYALNDAQQVILGTCALEDVALSVLATVVSTPARDRFVLDAGAKVLGYDRPAWVPGHGLLPAFPEATVSRVWEHHAVATSGAGPRPAVGDRVVVVPNHVCTVVNLVDELHVVRDGQMAERWPVDARGRNR